MKYNNKYNKIIMRFNNKQANSKMSIKNSKMKIITLKE